MQKIDYGDINKFLVSIGLVLITLALLTPYLFLKEDFGVMLSEKEQKSLTIEAKKIYEHKNNVILTLQTKLPWISGILVFFGVFSIICGLYRWFDRQAILDKKLILENDKLEKEISALTPQQKIDKATQELQEIELTKEIENLTQSINDATLKIKGIESNSVLKYLDIESKMVDRFIEYKSPNFKILSNQKLGRFDIDLLMKSKDNNKYSDRIVEIKYNANNVSRSYLNSVVLRLSSLIDFYQDSYNRNVVPVLIIVYGSDSIPQNKADELKIFLKERMDANKNMSRLKIEFVDEKSISAFDVRKILKR